MKRWRYLEYEGEGEETRRIVNMSVKGKSRRALPSLNPRISIHCYSMIL